MIPKILLLLIVINLFFVVGCTPEVLNENTNSPQKIEKIETPQKIDNLETPKTKLYFTLANEMPPDRNVKITLNGELVYKDKLKFGMGTSKKVNIEIKEGTFPFEVTDITTNIQKSTTINTENGTYVAVSFWGDSITIEQSRVEQVRYD